MLQLHIYVPHPKYYQAFRSIYRDPGMNHELIQKYQVQPLVHAGTLNDIYIIEIIKITDKYVSIIVPVISEILC